MSTIDRTIMRRSAIAAAAGAAGTVPMSAGKADDELPGRGPYRIEDWGKTWRNPNKARVLARVPDNRDAGHRRLLAADHASGAGAAGVCPTHPRSARLHPRLPRRADRARDEWRCHVRALDCPRNRSQGSL